MTDFNPNSLDSVLSRMTEKQDELLREFRESRRDFEARIKALERARYWLVGAAASAAVVAHAAWDWLFGSRLR